MANTTSLLDAIADRASIYALSHSSPIPDDRIVEVVSHCLKHAPGPFNVQSARVILVLGDEHYRLWDVAGEVYEVSSRCSFQGVRLAKEGERDSG